MGEQGTGEISERVARYVVAELLVGRAGRGFTDRTVLTSGLVDSLGMERLMSFLEEEFDVEIDPRDMLPNNFRTVVDIEALILRKRAAVR
jgi:acyl carrier protein